MADDYTLGGPLPKGTYSSGTPGQPTIVINNIPPKKPWLGRALVRTLLILSIIANLVMLGIVGNYFSNAFSQEKYLTGSKTSMDKIAVIDVKGAIMGTAIKGPIKDLQAAREDKSVKAVILRLNSPGGDVMSTDSLYRAILEFKAKTENQKPFVVLMDGMAASGGFWVAMPGDRILAGENAITGSIGVMAQTFVLTGLMKEWGIEPITFKTGERKDIGSMFREMTETDKAELNKLMNAWYEQFLKVILQHRREKVGGEEKLRAIADGRIVLGPEAKELGLIDDIGYLDDAIRVAKQLAGITGEARIVEYFHQPSLSDLFSVKQEAPPLISRETLTELQAPQILAMPPALVGFAGEAIQKP